MKNWKQANFINKRFILLIVLEVGGYGTWHQLGCGEDLVTDGWVRAHMGREGHITS
jgi:hypothetical protein